MSTIVWFVMGLKWALVPGCQRVYSPDPMCGLAVKCCPLSVR